MDSGTQAAESVVSGSKIGLRGVIENGAVVVDTGSDGPRIGIQKQFRRVESHPVVGIPRSVHPVSIDLASSYTGHVQLPRTVRTPFHVSIGLRTVEGHEHELHPFCSWCPQCEATAAVMQMCPEHLVGG